MLLVDKVDAGHQSQEALVLRRREQGRLGLRCLDGVGMAGHLAVGQDDPPGFAIDRGNLGGNAIDQAEQHVALAIEDGSLSQSQDLRTVGRQARSRACSVTEPAGRRQRYEGQVPGRTTASTEH